jgi:hypothetical protein
MGAGPGGMAYVGQRDRAKKKNATPFLAFLCQNCLKYLQQIGIER